MQRSRYNNHHAYQASVRQGFRWWEIDPTFYIIKALSWLGVVWDLKSPPEAVLRNEQKLGSWVIDRAAKDVVATFNVDAISSGLNQALETTPGLADLRARIATAQHRAHEVLAHVHLPHFRPGRRSARGLRACSSRPVPWTRLSSGPTA
jgi:stearoyl-CoA desaturase (delta-9 desaturase)